MAFNQPPSGASRMNVYPGGPPRTDLGPTLALVQDDGVRDILSMLLDLIQEVYPSCRERSLAITTLQELAFWCVACQALVKPSGAS